MDADLDIPLAGTSNLRDLGRVLGLPRGPDSAYRVLRSANLDNLAPAGRRGFEALGIAVVIDLRGVAEAAAAPTLPGTERVHLPIEPTVVAELRRHRAAGTLSAAAAVGVMEATYRDYVVDHAAVFAEVLHRVLSAKRRPVLFHCAAGKDRTGLAAALILTAIGAESSAIMTDYLLSNRLYRPTATTATDLPDEVRAAIGSVRPSFLEAAYAAMSEGWGGPVAYLEAALGIGARERDALREAFTPDD